MTEIKLSFLVEKFGGQFACEKDSEATISGCASLKHATINDLTYFNTDSFTRQDGEALRKDLSGTSAGAVLTNSFIKDLHFPQIIVENPKSIFQKILSFIYDTPLKTGISDTAKIDNTVFFTDKNSVFIDTFTILEKGVKIGKNVQIGSHSVIKENSIIGDNTIIENHVSIESTEIGKNCWVGPGVRIGSRGFGYATTANGHQFVPHIGKVMIGDSVDIGANTCIDRGMLDDTLIDDGTKIDDLVIVGHGCQIGKHCFIAAQTGMAGGTILEDWVFVGGQVGFGGHLRVKAGTHVTGKAGVISDIGPGIFMGFPAEHRKAFLRKQVLLKNLIKKEDK